MICKIACLWAPIFTVYEISIPDYKYECVPISDLRFISSARFLEVSFRIQTLLKEVPEVDISAKAR